MTEGVGTDSTQELTNALTPVSNPWDVSDSLVFLGFRVLWKRRVADNDRNLQFARDWERDFDAWNVNGRDVDLMAPSKGYFVRLQDGVAFFGTEGAKAYSQAVNHVTEVLRTLADDQDAPGLVNIEAQFLVPVERPFPELVAHLDSSLVNPLVRNRLGAKTVDLAYLVDMEVNGVWRQVNIGAVKAHEIPRRVAARTLKKAPPVSLFVSVTSRKPFRHNLSELSELVCDTARLGRETLEAIQL